MIQLFEQEFDDVLISSNKELLNVDFLHNYLSTKTYWAVNIPKHVVETSIENSICFGVYKNNIQIGFARVVSDCASFAYLADVFIIEEERGNGYSKMLMQTIHQHPDLQIIRGWMLKTRDAHGLYEQFNWQKIDDIVKERIMQISNPDVYKNLK